METFSSDLQERLLTMADDSNDGLVRVPAASTSSRTVPPSSVDPPFYRNPNQMSAMLSNYSNAYNTANISPVLLILQDLYLSEENETDVAASASSLLAGMMVGQLVGGALGDSRLGRMGSLRLVVLLMMIASLGSCTLMDHRENWNIFVGLAVWRFALGVGAGGVYPLAAVLSAEQPNAGAADDEQTALHRIVLTFAMQGLGFVTVPLVTLVLLALPIPLDWVWRLILALGSLPGILLFVLQWALYQKQMDWNDVQVDDEDEPEAVAATAMDGGGDGSVSSFPSNPQEEQAMSSSLSIEDAPDSTVVDHVDSTDDNDTLHTSPPRDDRTSGGWWASISHEPKLGHKLIGTAGCWFLFDVLFYGNTLFQLVVIEAAFGTQETESSRANLLETTINSLLLTSIALPGYAVVALVLGKRVCGIQQTPTYVMMQGFAAMAVLYGFIGCFWKDLSEIPELLVALYALTFFFANHGPNTITFLLPSRVYSHDCRSTLNGVSAAAGKLGALLGATFFDPLLDDIGADRIMMICSGVALVGFGIARWFSRIPHISSYHRVAAPSDDRVV